MYWKEESRLRFFERTDPPDSLKGWNRLLWKVGSEYFVKFDPYPLKDWIQILWMVGTEYFERLDPDPLKVGSKVWSYLLKGWIQILWKKDGFYLWKDGSICFKWLDPIFWKVGSISFKSLDPIFWKVGAITFNPIKSGIGI